MKKIIPLVLGLLFAAFPAMADTPFTSFATGAPSALPLQGQENVVVQTGGVTKNATAQALGHIGQIVVTDSPYNASGYIAQTVTAGTNAQTATNIQVASSAGFYVGHIATVALGGTGCNTNFSAAITAIPDSTHVTLASVALTGASLPPTSTSGSSGIICSTGVPANYLVYEIGTTTTTASAAHSATSITLSNANSYAVGQGILISTGASGGGNLITSVTSVNTSSGVVGISPGIGNASGTASGVNVQHDDTAAFQAALNQLSYTKSIKIFVPDGFYNINGAPSGTENAALHIPVILYYPGCCGSTTLWDAQSTLEITGNAPAPQAQSYISFFEIAPMNGAILHTDNTGSTYNLIDGTYNSTSLDNSTNVQFVVRNLTFRNYPNPWVSMMSCRYIQSCSAFNSTFDTGETGQTTQPTHTSQMAIVGPYGSNGGNIEFFNLEFYGQYTGIWVNEHTSLRHIRFDADFQPMLTGNAGNNNYGWNAEDVECNGTPHCIVTQGTNPQPVNVNLLNIEHTTTPGWADDVDDIKDANNILFGLVTVDSANFDGYPMSVSGALNLHYSHVHQCPAYPMPCVTFSGLAANPNGWIEWCSDCTVGATCAGSGTGAIAVRVGGAWTCK